MYRKYEYDVNKPLHRKFGKDIEIVIKILDDEFPDLDWIGTWEVDKIDAIRVPEYMRPDYDRDVKYFKPSNSIKANYAYWLNSGKAPLRAAIEAVKEARQDMELLHDFDVQNRFMVGVIAEIYYKGIKIADDSVWGVDVEMYTDKNQDGLEEVAFDVTFQAVLQAQEYLASLEANTTEIDRLVIAYMRVAIWRKS